jgi:hypothetical protein
MPSAVVAAVVTEQVTSADAVRLTNGAVVDVVRAATNRGLHCSPIPHRLEGNAPIARSSGAT